MAKFKCHHSITKVRVPAVKREIKHHVNMDTDMFNPFNTENWMNCAPLAPPVRRDEPMGTVFTRLPFAYPTSQENHNMVNQILQFSLRQQRDEDISSCSGFVSHVIRLCLKSVGINCKIESGNFEIDSETSPHMWLIINDRIIDNCYVKTMTKEKIALVEEKYPKCYKTAVYSYSNSDLVSLEKDKIIKLKAKKLIDLFKQNIQKAFILCLNREDLSNYFFAMIRYMWDEHKVNISGVDPGIRFICWHCGKYPPLSGLFLNDVIPDHVGDDMLLDDQACTGFNSDELPAEIGWKFPVCGRCKVASYCSQTCQGLNWKDNHKYTCQTRSSVMLLPSDGPD